MTEGYLSKSSADVTWGSQVPLGQPFSVRDPLWAWGTGRTLTSGDGSAIPTIVTGLFFDGLALLLLYALVVVVRDTRARRGEADGCPCPLAQIRAESAEHIIPIAVTTEAAFVAMHAVGEEVLVRRSCRSARMPSGAVGETDAMDRQTIAAGWLTLRPFTPADIPWVYEVSLDPVLQRFMQVPSPCRLEDAASHVEQAYIPGWDDGRRAEFVAEDAATAIQWAGSACAWESLARPKWGTGSIRAPASVASPPPRSGRSASGPSLRRASNSSSGAAKRATSLLAGSQRRRIPHRGDAA